MPTQRSSAGLNSAVPNGTGPILRPPNPSLRTGFRLSSLKGLVNLCRSLPSTPPSAACWAIMSPPPRGWFIVTRPPSQTKHPALKQRRNPEPDLRTSGRKAPPGRCNYPAKEWGLLRRPVSGREGSPQSVRWVRCHRDFWRNTCGVLIQFRKACLAPAELPDL
jgi:hypothetical protein